MKKSRSSRPLLFCKKGVFISKISQNSQGSTCAGVSFWLICRSKVFLYEFCEICNNSYFVKHLQTTAFENHVYSDTFVQ